MITEESIQQDIKDIEAKIRWYKIKYIIIAFYCSMYRLFFSVMIENLEILFLKEETRNRKIKVGVYSAILFNGPWMLKPVFGYLGDVFSPFGYRTLGYVRIICVIDLAIQTSMYFIDLSKDNISTYLTLLLLYIITSSFLDSIVQGMTTITVVMELRLIQKKNPFGENKHRNEAINSEILDDNTIKNSSEDKGLVWRPNVASNFTIYILTTYLAYCFWLFIGTYTFLGSKRSGEEARLHGLLHKSNTISLFCIASSVALFICSFWFQELKRTKWITKVSRKKQFSQVLKSIFISKHSALIYILCILSINPANYFFSLTARFFSSKSRQTIPNELFRSSPALVGGLLTCLLLLYSIIRWKVVRSNWYISIICLVSIVNLLNHLILSYWSDGGVLDSVPMLFMYGVEGYLGLDAVSALSKVCLIDQFILNSPKGYEVFYVNALVSLIAVSRGLGKVLSSYEDAYFDISTLEVENLKIENLRSSVYLNWPFILIPYLLYRLYSCKRKAERELPSFIPTEYDLINESHNIDEWKEIDGELDEEKK